MLIRSFLAYGVSVVSTLSIIEKGIIDVQKAISFKRLEILSFNATYHMAHMHQKSSISSLKKWQIQDFWMSISGLDRNIRLVIKLYKVTSLKTNRLETPFASHPQVLTKFRFQQQFKLPISALNLILIRPIYPAPKTLPRNSNLWKV